MKLAFNNVTKRFGEGEKTVHAVHDVDLTVEPGELLVLLGPSGCGKSTLLNLCAGLERPTSGEIVFGERIVAAPDRKTFLPPKQRDVAMVFQSYALYPHLTVFGNIAFPLRIERQKKREIEPAVAEIAELLHITNLLARKPGELSGGQRQRVAIARALVRRPSVFLLDEPLSNLDAKLRTSTRTELKRLQRELGVTTIYVTHDQVEAMAIGDRVALLRDGRIDQIGTPEDLYDRPATPFAASFIGSPPMNLLPARIAEPVSEAAADKLPVVVDCAGHRIAVRNQGRLGSVHRGHEVRLGVRPEHINVETALDREPAPSMAATGGPIVLRVTVDAIETLGRDYLYHATSDGHPILALSDHLGPREGEAARLTFDVGRVHLFTPEP